MKWHCGKYCSTDIRQDGTGAGCRDGSSGFALPWMGSGSESELVEESLSVVETLLARQPGSSKVNYRNASLLRMVRAVMDTGRDGKVGLVGFVGTWRIGMHVPNRQNKSRGRIDR